MKVRCGLSRGSGRGRRSVVDGFRPVKILFAVVVLIVAVKGLFFLMRQTAAVVIELRWTRVSHGPLACDGEISKCAKGKK